MPLGSAISAIAGPWQRGAASPPPGRKRRSGSRELKNRLGKYLGLVRQGQTIQITDRGKPFACILPGPEPVGIEGQTVARLLASGTLRLAKGPLRRRANPTRMTSGKSIAELVREDRR